MEGNRRRTVDMIMVLRRGETAVNPGTFKKTVRKLTDCSLLGMLHPESFHGFCFVSRMDPRAVILTPRPTSMRSTKPVAKTIGKKPSSEIMIPRRRDFLGDLADWVAKSPENERELEAMLEEIFEEVAQNRKARGEVAPPTSKAAKLTKKKHSAKKNTLAWKVKLPTGLPAVPAKALELKSAKSPDKKLSKKK